MFHGIETYYTVHLSLPLSFPSFNFLTFLPLQLFIYPLHYFLLSWNPFPYQLKIYCFYCAASQPDHILVISKRDRSHYTLRSTKDSKDTGWPRSNIYCGQSESGKLLPAMLIAPYKITRCARACVSPKVSNILTTGTTLDVEMCETSSCPWKSPLCHSRHKLCKNNLSHWKQKAALSLITKDLKIGLSLRRESDHQSSEFCIVLPLKEYSCKFASL